MSQTQPVEEKQDQDIAAFETQAARYAHEQKFEEAIDAHCRALLIAGEMDRPRLKAVLFSNLGRTLRAANRVQDTVRAYEAGLHALQGSDNFDLTNTLQSLGLISKGYGDVRDFTMPDVYRPETFSEIHQAEADPQLATKLLIEIGNAYLRQPQEQPALNAYQQALDLSEINHDPELRAQALANIGEVLRRQGQPDLAETRLKEAIDVFKRSKHPADARRALALLAGIARDRKQFAEALTLYQEALVLYDKSRDNPGKARVLAGLGRLYLILQRYTEAHTTYTQAIKFANQTDDTDTLWHAYWGIGNCQEQAGEWLAAEQSFRQSLALIQNRMNDLRTDEGKVTFLETVQDIYDRLLSVLLEQAEADPKRFVQALEVAEEARGQALLALMGRSSRNSAPVEASGNLQVLDQVIHNSVVQMAPAIVVPTSSTARAAPASKKSAPKRPHKQSIMQPMPTLARLVFHVLVDRTVVFAVLPDGAVHGHVIHQGRDELDRQVMLVRRALCRGDQLRGVQMRNAVLVVEGPARADDVDIHAALRALYDTLIEPVAALLPNAATALVIEPHCGLWMLPFAALQAADGTYLSDQFPLIYTPSAQVLADIRQQPDYGEPKTLRALIVGNPHMPTRGLDAFDILRFDPLPGAEREARDIAALFPTRRRKLLVGTKAVRTVVQKAAERYGIVHLATHGIAFAHQPLNSFVVLAENKVADGMLTAREVMALFLPADLVTLSACQTGLGQVSGDGMIGLSRAFLVSGARAVLVSQWSVSDEATSALMLNFYRHYLDSDNKAIALQSAMRELRQDPKYQDPSFWAAFTLVGAEA